jgi:L-fuconolactonase
MSTAEFHEEILDPDLPIVDPHHHIWHLPDALLDSLDKLPGKDGTDIARMYRLHRRYLIDELLADLNAGHNIRATVFADAHTMYRAKGPAELKSIGEVEFVAGFGAMADSGTFGDTRFCAGIIGSVDMTLGDAVADILPLHIQAANRRYRGIRPPVMLYDAKLAAIRDILAQPHVLQNPQFLVGARHLAPLDLSLDLFVLHEQLPEVLQVARALPDTRIVLNHTGGPTGIGDHAADRPGAFAYWREQMKAIAECENVVVKVGGLGMPLCGFTTSALVERAGSEALARDWAPHIETAIALFGANRCMFESNFPIDGVTARYPSIWNAFKRVVRNYSADEKAALFAGTAARTYRIDFD